MADHPHQFSKAGAFAHMQHQPLCEELATAGFDLFDNDALLHFDTDCAEDSSGVWAVDFQPDDHGHQMLVFSIHGNDSCPYGISYAITLCGQPRGVCYWSGRDDAIVTGRDPEWPGLAAAVQKARQLRLMHLEVQ